MKAFSVFVFFLLTFAPLSVKAQTNPDQIQEMEMSGDILGARTALTRAVQDKPNSVQDLREYAEFLERYGDPGARQAYSRLLSALHGSEDSAQAGVIARRMLVLDLLAGKNDVAASDMEAYRAVTGRTLTVSKATRGPAQEWGTASIPGPLHSFARMAAVAPEATPEDILPSLARNVVTNGYQASHSNEALEQTEYLKLVHRYLSQARELDSLAGADKVIKIGTCDSPQTGELLRVLGFRMRGGCGSELVLETVNASRAFLTADSGFPINQLEKALRENRPFTYDYHPAQVPVLFGPQYWMNAVKEKDSNDFIEVLISDPSLCRLYLGLSKLDPETADGLRKAVPFPRLRAFSHVLDFFGGMFEIRNGKAVVPGGQRSATAWADLVGVSPDQGAQFFDKLMAKDDGWLASLYDALARIRGPVQTYLTDPVRMKRFYMAVRGKITSPGPARPVFRSNTDMMLLTTRLHLDPNGKPHIPGNLDVWKNLFTNHPQGKYDGKLTRIAATWKEPDDVLEALFALCRKSVANEPLRIFMAISDIDHYRPQPLQPATVDRLARQYHIYDAQFPIFSESRNLSDAAIVQFLDTAEAINKIHDPQFRADVAGMFQGLIGLWQIFVRQGTLPASEHDAAFRQITGAFAQMHNDRDLFDAGRAGMTALLAGVPGRKDVPAGAHAQDRMVALLAGASESEDAEARDQIAQEINHVLDAQRIVSLDTLFQLADHLQNVAKGEKLNTALVNKLATRISELPLPRTSLSSAEKNAMGFGYWTEKHIEAERKLNLRTAAERDAKDPQKLQDLRGQLAPQLRDTLVAFNYAYYAPPGAQVLYTNPVFVRSHDFIGIQGASHTWRATESYGSGWPSNGGGRLVGSLATLPYALAEAEQNFLIPTQTQALIWGDLVPQMMLSAKTPPWWNVTPMQIHWVGLHVRYGRELLAEAAFDPDLRTDVVSALSMFAAPARSSEVRRLLEQSDVKEAVDQVTPSELFSLASELAPKRTRDGSCVGADIQHLEQVSPKDVSYAAIAHAFGTPKPTLANSYEPELMNLRTFPALMGYSSRIMAESWESNNLYWAELADELSISPAELNVRIPQWTEKLVENIFASHLEDWPALLKSLRAVGDDVRARSRATTMAEQKAQAQN